MAPPTSRRSGFSRRAQYGTFIAYVVGAVGAVVGAVLLIVSLLNPHAFASWRSAATDVTAPAATVASTGRSESRGFFDALAGYFEAGTKNARLERELGETRTRLIEAEAASAENRRLKALLQLYDDKPRPIATARLIGSTSSSTRRFATISVGARDGVTTGMAVRSPLGLVGRVLEVGQRSARVLLLTDAESIVPVRRAGDDIAGFATGHGNGTVQMRLISLGLNPLNVGDPLVTSGSGGLYRPGIAVGVITRLTRDGAFAKVFADPAGTDLVVVDPTWNPAPAPPLPAAAPPPAKASKTSAKRTGHKK